MISINTMERYIFRPRKIKSHRMRSNKTGAANKWWNYLQRIKEVSINQEMNVFKYVFCCVYIFHSGRTSFTSRHFLKPEYIQKFTYKLGWYKFNCLSFNIAVQYVNNCNKATNAIQINIYKLNAKI